MDQVSLLIIFFDQFIHLSPLFLILLIYFLVSRTFINSRQWGTLGSHTHTHPAMSLCSLNDCYNEMQLSSSTIESHLGLKPLHFAFPFGQITALSKSAFLAACSSYKFIYTNIRGNNSKYLCSHLILRDSILPNYSIYKVASILYGLFDYRYLNCVRLTKQWISDLYHTCVDK